MDIALKFVYLKLALPEGYNSVEKAKDFIYSRFGTMINWNSVKEEVVGKTSMSLSVEMDWGIDDYLEEEESRLEVEKEELMEKITAQQEYIEELHETIDKQADYIEKSKLEHYEPELKVEYSIKKSEQEICISEINIKLNKIMESLNANQEVESQQMELSMKTMEIFCLQEALFSAYIKNIDTFYGKILDTLFQRFLILQEFEEASPAVDSALKNSIRALLRRLRESSQESEIFITPSYKEKLLTLLNLCGESLKSIRFIEIENKNDVYKSSAFSNTPFYQPFTFAFECV